MNSLFALSRKDYEDLIRETARLMGVQEGIVEKDIWVCVGLDRIFRSSEYGPHFIFKGGTSLSKVHKVIDRFSEDVDLILNWEILGYGSERTQPWDDTRSNTQQDKLNKRMNAETAEFLRTYFVPWLRTELSGLGDRAPTVAHDRDQGVLIQYEPLFELSYIQSHVLLEIGPLASWVPHEAAVSRPYVAEYFPSAVGNIQVPVTVSTFERTFWEKATILHEQYHNPRTPARRYSRHYYDLYMMMQRGTADRAIRDTALLEEVARFKQRFYYSKHSRYDLAQPGTLRLVPSDEKASALRKDYDDMQVMFFGTAPQWDHVLAELLRLEKRINDEGHSHDGARH